MDNVSVTVYANSAEYDIRKLVSTKIYTKHMWSTTGSESDSYTDAGIFPIVSLSSMLQVKDGDGTSKEEAFVLSK